MTLHTTQDITMWFLDTKKSTELVQSIGSSICGIITAGVGVESNNTWAIIVGSALGAGSVAWTFGIWLRDRTFLYLRKQNEELWGELNKLNDALAQQRNTQQNLNIAMSTRSDAMDVRVDKMDSHDHE